MRVLYLSYGPQSGVTASVLRQLSSSRVEALHEDPLARFMWQLRPGSKIPNPRPAALRAFVESLRRHGRNWKTYWVHTPYAFDHLSDVAGEAIRRVRPDAILQAGVLFGPGRVPEARYHLYVDHTRAIAEAYEPAPGLVPPLPIDPPWRAREERVYRGAAAIFAMSDFVARSLVRDYGVDPARVHVVGAGPNVEPGPGHLSAVRQQAILFVGRNFAAKGGPDLLEAFQRVRQEHPGVRLWIVSDRAPPALPEGAVFHGPLGPQALAVLYARATVFALPTLREAFGISFLEAMSFGLPVVASRLEAIPEIVSDGETGILVPPRDASALANALCALLADPVRARLLGAAGRARAAARFGWDRAVLRMVEVMRPPPAEDAARAG